MFRRSALALSLALIFAAPAFADLAHGTPLFTCTKPTQGLDSFGAMYTLPASGTDALKEIRFYVDPTVDASGHILTPASPQFASPAASACQWQTATGDIGAGAHTLRATAVDNGGRESAATNPLAFTVPAATHLGPIAPSGLTAQ